MDIILKQDIQNLGYANDIVTVKDGYARNYLVPKGLAIIADKTSRKVHAENMKQKAFKESKVRTEAEALAAKLEKVLLTIGAKAATTGKIFGSVNAIQIAEALKEQFNYEVDRKRIKLDGESIKELGQYEALVNLHKEIKATIKFEVVAE
ncbi:MAG TPA: 50S ribosomal protein L9 [Bacteroidales bacterium]|mgnify:CR=1 FL=1|nr:50S ribosomal protein L9 [Bacteroidales bacterium]